MIQRRLSYILPKGTERFQSNFNLQPGVAIYSKMLLGEVLNSSQYALHRSNNLLYYELLDMSLAELEKKQRMSLMYVEKGIKEMGVHTLLVDKQALWLDVGRMMLSKLELSDRTKYRLVEIRGSKRFKEFQLSDPISTYSQLDNIIFEVFILCFNLRL